MSNFPNQSTTELWFYLETYVFIFKGDNNTVIYNTLNSAYIICPLENAAVNQLVNSLLNEKGYCVKIKSEVFADEEFYKFAEKVRSSYSGDYVDCNNIKRKPFIFRPLLRLRDNFHQSFIKSEDVTKGGNILNHLNEVSLYLTQTCEQQCPYCSQYYKQFMSCTTFSTEMDYAIDKLVVTLDKMDKIGVGLVNFLGGNVFKYKYINELVASLDNYTFKKHFYIHYDHIDISIAPILHNMIANNCLMTVILNAESVPDELNPLLCGNRDVWAFILITDSEQSFLKSSKFIEKNPTLEIQSQPFFNGHNIDFFKKYVFMTSEDLTNIPVSKTTIFRRQVLNENFFGKLSILTNGDVYSNMNHEPIGNAFENDLSINEIVFNEMYNGKNWFKIRNEGACMDCCNKYLCPSLSNYEFVCNRPNLCNIKE
jgi:pseudo-rSAM protein